MVLVLASGRGERFRASGGTVHKLQADLAGRTVLERTLDAVRASGLPFHLEDAGHPGMGDSIAAAVRATPQASAWLILPGDLPLIQPQTLSLVAQAPMPHDVVLPVFEGQRGHPVRFSRSCGPELAALEGNRGAALIVKAHAAMEIIVNDEGCVCDIDTLDDLARAARLLQSRA